MLKIEYVKIKDVFNLYSIQLAEIYTKNEITNLFHYSMNYLLKMSRADTILKKEENVTEEMILKFVEIIEALKKECPIEYISGEALFFGNKINVNKHVLIPRPETEELVQLIVSEQKNNDLYILDAGTGSGCIAISIKKCLPNNKVYAIDNSPEALKVAMKNANRNKVDINFQEKDILKKEELEKLPLFDIIVSNPPYIRESEKKWMKKNVLNFEPTNALFVSDQNPLIFYRAIAEFSKKHLKRNGTLYYEINENLSDELIELHQNLGFSLTNVIKDINQKDRILRCSFLK